MKIYVIHATSYPDYREYIYNAFKKSDLLNKHTFIFPHENSDQVINSKNIIAESDLIIAEVSYPSTGLGIELGWAESAKRKVLCIHKEETKPSASLNVLTSDFVKYSNAETMIENVISWLNNYEKSLAQSARFFLQPQMN